MKKAQSGTKVSSSKIKQNTKDATIGNGVNSRPVFKGPNSGPRVKPTLGGARNGKTMKSGKRGC